MALKPSLRSGDVYSNPRNIYIQQKVSDGKETGKWYYQITWCRKENGHYAILALNNSTHRDLDQELAYEVIDTLKVSPTAEHVNQENRDKNLEPLEEAYKTGSWLVEKTVSKKFSFASLFTKAEMSSRDSLITYDAKTKTLKTLTTPAVKYQGSDYGPLALTIIFLILGIFFLVKDWRWFAEQKEKFFQANGIIKTDHALATVYLLFAFAFFLIFYRFTNYYQHQPAITACWAIINLVAYQVVALFNLRKSKWATPFLSIYWVGLMLTLNLGFLGVNPEAKAILVLPLALLWLLAPVIGFFMKSNLKN